MDATVKRSELKQHIARVAAQLFFAEGIHAVGVDRIADAAHVTKRTLYHHYPSKDEVIAAALRASPIVRFPESGDPVARIVGAFETAAAFLAETAFRGCPYIFFNAELIERRHPARAIIERRVAQRKAWFCDRARDAGAHDPQELGEQLDVLFDGALASGTKRGDLAPARAALAAARALIAAAIA